MRCRFLRQNKQFFRLMNEVNCSRKFFVSVTELLTNNFFYELEVAYAKIFHCKFFFGQLSKSFENFVPDLFDCHCY